MINFESLRLFCTDGKRVENYEIALNDPTETWDIHHRAEISAKAKERLKDKRNHPMYGRKQSEETKRKISETKRKKRTK